MHRLDDETRFRGDLIGERVLKLDSLVGEPSLRAVCLAFDRVFINTRRIDYGQAPTVIAEMTEPNERVVVPIHAVDDIEPIAA